MLAGGRRSSPRRLLLRGAAAAARPGSSRPAAASARSSSWSTPPSCSPSPPALALLLQRHWGLGHARWLAVKIGLILFLLVPLEAMHAWIAHVWIARGLRQTPRPPLSKDLVRGIGMDDMLRALAAPLLGLARAAIGLAVAAASPGHAVAGCVLHFDPRAVICMSTNRVTTAPTVTVSPVYPSKKNA